MNEMNNYRPISVLFVLSRVFGQIVYNQLLDILQLNEILTKSPFENGELCIWNRKFRSLA